MTEDMAITYLAHLEPQHTGEYMRYIIEGPADIGNVFCFFKAGLVPAGKFAIIGETGEYANGGNGPSTVDGVLYDSAEAAEKAMKAQGEPSM